MTERILNAMDNRHLNIFAHPTARQINIRLPIELNMDKVFEKARDTKTIMEINAQPLRLDLKDTHVKAAKEAGVKLSLGTDAHSTESLNYMPLGVYTARRGWAEPKDIVNTWPLEKLMKILKTP
jgi:DNA polymerase (family 10)